MLRTHDNWERLVAATLRRQQLWELCHAPSRTPSVRSLSSDFSFRSHLPDFRLEFSISTSWYPQNSVLGVEASRWGYDSNRSELESVAEILPVLKPEEIFVNGKSLRGRELAILLSCPNPPKRLKQGVYWYDKVAGFWGKQGQKPSQIISAHLNVGGLVERYASNGNTSVLINGREITRAEVNLLKFAGVRCRHDTRIWMSEDGSCQLEGQKHILGNIFCKAGAKLLCSVLSLPFPSKHSHASGEQSVPDNIISKDIQRLLLIGGNESATSTIFKQALFLYKDIPFLEDELKNIKLLIQSNVFRYICMLEDTSEHSDEENLYQLSFEERAYTGSMRSASTSLIHECTPLVEKLWRDPAFREMVKQRSESAMIPSVAHYFLERVLDLFKPDYKPSHMDILHAEGFPSSLSFVDFSLPQPQDDFIDIADHQNVMLRYQLIRPPAKGFGDGYIVFEGVHIVIFCISLCDYDQLVTDEDGDSVNKMIFDKKVFERTVTDPSFEEMPVLLLLTEYDLFDEKIKQVPLSRCDWFTEFDPVKLSNGSVSQLGQKGFEYISCKFKNLCKSLTGRKLYVTWVDILDADSVDAALKYAGEILKWNDEMSEYFYTSDGSSYYSSEEDR